MGKPVRFVIFGYISQAIIINIIVMQFKKLNFVEMVLKL